MMLNKDMWEKVQIGTVVKELRENSKNPIKHFVISKIVDGIRKWDIKTAGRVDYYVANSQNIADKIKKYYGVKADVIHPPVDTEFFKPIDLKIFLHLKSSNLK